MATGKSRAVRVSAMPAAAVATALLLGAGVAQPVNGAIGSEPQSQGVTQATDPPSGGCCPGGNTVCPPGIPRCA